ncbi:MAG: FeS-binding protein [Actinobacteria bacterium]|nr:MAG: FeS-binding protein [Actinomycetota bacterium]
MAKTITFALMDPPYETAATTTAFRIIDSALRKGHKVNVFAYEGAVNLTMAGQSPHPNPVKGTSAEEEEHPNTKDWVSSLLKNHGDRLEWINCGLCVDERGAADTVEGPKRGSPKEFAEWVKASDNTVVIPAK